MTRDELVQECTDRYILHVKILSILPTDWNYGHVSLDDVFIEECDLADVQQMHTWLSNNLNTARYARDYANSSERHAIVFECFSSLHDIKFDLIFFVPCGDEVEAWVNKVKPVEEHVSA